MAELPLPSKDASGTDLTQSAAQATSSTPSAIPQRLGDFRIEREIGRGGMGVVYEAVQESLGRRVALKILPQSIMLGDQQRRRFEREARAAAQLHHTNIVPVFGVGEEHGISYYIMQFIDGQPLDKVIDSLRQQAQKLSPSAPSHTPRDADQLPQKAPGELPHHDHAQTTIDMSPAMRVDQMKPETVQEVDKPLDASSGFSTDFLRLSASDSVGSASGGLTVDGTGSSLTASISMDVGVVGAGHVAVTHGGVVTVTGPFTIGSKGSAEGNSIIAANVRNGGTIAPGIAGTATASDAFGTLQINGNYTQTSAAILQIDLHTLSEHDLLSIQGTATLAGVLNLNQAAGFSPVAGDRFTILTSTGRTCVFDNVTTQVNPAIRLTTFYNATDVAILATDATEKTWGIDANGNSSLAANWIGGAPGAVNDKVAFSTAITADRTVTLDTSFTAGSIYFDGGKNYTLQGPGGITLAVSESNSASLTMKDLHGAGSHTISAPLTIDNNATFNIAPLTTLQITQQINSAGVALTKTGTGTLVLKNVRSDSLNDTAGTVQITPGGGAAGTSTLKSLVISSARLDLNNNDLLIDYSGASPLATIRGYLLSGLIVSSTGQKTGNTVHAIVDNALLHLSSWNGLPIDDTTVIAKYTVRGDANLDGAVGFADLVAVAQNYGNSTGHATWTMGDFNYDGDVDFADLVVVAQNYGGALPASLPDAAADFNADLARAASVPEPSVIILGLAAMGATTRRRHRPWDRKRSHTNADLRIDQYGHSQL